MFSRSAIAPRISWIERASRLLALAAIVGLLLVLAVRAADYLWYAARAITFPFELAYGEGIIWQQALLIPGSLMYGDITHFPFIVFHYTPVYHLTVRAISAMGIDPLATGRGITVAATLAIAVLVAAIAFTAMRKIGLTSARIIGAAVAGLMVLTYQPVQMWAVLMRVDMLAIALGIAGVYLTIVAGQRTILLCAAVLLFVLAVYTKQTELAAPVAAMVVAAMVNARSTLKALSFGLFSGAIAFTVLQLSTDGGFWRHIFTYNAHNGFFFHGIVDGILEQKPEALGLLTGVIAFALLWWIEATPKCGRSLKTWISAIRQSTRLRTLAITSLWFVLASAQLVTLGKWGSSSNYLIEWMCITTVPIGMVASLVWSGAVAGKSLSIPMVTGLFLSLTLAAHALHRPLYKNGIVNDHNGTELRAHLIDLIRESRDPTLSEDMVLLLRAGQQVPIEPAIFAALARTGIWDQRPFLKLIQDHAFGLLIMENHNWGRYTNEIMRAIDNHYPLIERSGGYVIRHHAAP
jgi:hypothetical protein